MKEEVQAWFDDGCHFGTGMTLLARTGQHHITYAKLTPYMRGSYVPPSAKRKLQSVLNTWLQSQPLASQPIEEKSMPVQQVSASSTVAAAPASNAEVIPDEIAALKVQAVALHKRHSFVNAQMHETTSDEDRLKYATEIMEEIIPSLDEKYAAIRAWKEEGTLPSAITQNDLVKVAIQKMKKVDSLKPRISRLKGLIKKATGKKKQDYEIELMDKEKELLLIKKEYDL